MMSAPAKIMVVEDERIVALHLSRQLTKLGYQVLPIVSSGDKAIRQVKELHPDILLMDIHIDGKMDGIETAQHIACEFDTPIIYLTAHSEDATVQRATKTRPYGYLIKPFAERELNVTIQMVLERRQAELALRESEKRLHRAQKLETIGQLTGGIAHDFNNLLSVVIGNMDLLEERLAPGSEEARLVHSVIKAAERGADLTRQLLAFARQQPLKSRLVDPAPILKTIAQLLRRTLGENIALDLRLPPKPWHVSIDVAQLEAAILNLAVNARDAMPDGGTLTIDVNNVSVDEIYVELNPEAAAGDYVAISITDTGEGIPPDVVEKVFEPFFTTKGTRGTGLGLSMVHGFVKQSGGHTRIYSEVGIGTTVHLYLPRTTAQGEVEPIPVESASHEGGSECILVVEDNQLLHDSVVRQLQRLGYSTISAREGVEAVKILRSDADIQLVLTDMVMPGGIDGRAVAAEARKQHPKIKILFTSGFPAGSAPAAVPDDLGATLLSKPYRKSELARRVRAALDGTDGGEV